MLNYVYMNTDSAPKTVLIFDFDGTIADTHKYIISISNRLADEFNYLKIPDTDIEAMREKTAQEMISILKVPMLKIPAIVAKAKKEFYEGIADIEPIEGLKEVLNKLWESGIRMGILSSNNEKNISAFLDQHGLKDVFSFVQTTSKVWTKNTSLKKLIKSYGLDINHLMYVGDETRDITAAKKINTKIIAVSWGYNSAGTLAEHNPDYLVNSPAELLQFI